MKTRVSIIVIVLFFVFPTISFSDVEGDYTKTITIQGKEIELRDGLELLKKYLGRVYINRGRETLKNVKFDETNFEYADIRETRFENCSFKNVTFRGTNTYACNFVSCDFHGTDISNSNVYGLDFNSLKTTSDYKRKSFVNCKFGDFDFSGLDFTGFTFMYVEFVDVRGDAKTDFGDVYFQNVTFVHSFRLTKEQILLTKNFKQGFFQGIIFERFRDASNEPISLSDVDCSGMLFINCQMDIDFKNTSLRDSIILSDFSGAKNLTLEQIKSTWNYKHNRMAGIKLPSEIQKALDAEKEK